MNLTLRTIVPESTRARLPQIRSVLLCAMFFAIPTHVSIAYGLTALLVVAWILGDDWREGFSRQLLNPIVWAGWALVAAFALSLLWTTDIRNGVSMVGKYALLLLLPVYFEAYRHEHRHIYIGSFLAGVASCEALAYYNWMREHVFPDWPRGIQVRKSAGDTAPFVDRILYTPILAWAGYMAGHSALFGKESRQRLLYGVLYASTALNLLISGGRTGQLVFAVLTGMLVIQRFPGRRLVATTAAVVLVAAMVGIGYESSTEFRIRLDDAVDEMNAYQGEARDGAVNTSTGLRVTFWTNTVRMVLEHPWLGVGAGDFTHEYARINALYSPDWVATWNPHNQFLFVLSTTGILGFVPLLLLLFPLPLWRLPYGDGYDRHRVAFAVFFAVICMFESYLWRSNTRMTLILFSVLLYAPVLNRFSATSSTPRG